VSQALGLADLPVGRGELFLGKYLIGETLGAGGMGVVVAAEHVQLGQKVAVKFLSLELRQNADGVARFLREARAAARIRSEHVVRVVDVDGATGDVCYMVMELLDGEDLARVVRLRGRLSTEVAVGYILQACEAIAEAHELGIVHRDLKPSNLFVTYRRDGSPLLKVLDFGISKAVDAGAGGVGDGRERPTDLTSSRMVLGSPMYMSPEQVRSTKNVDARTDVWALGVILHELLTGQPAFNGESTMEVLAKIVADPPPRLREVRPELSVEMERIVLACLEKTAATRVPSVGALAQRLAPFAPSWASATIGRILGTGPKLDVARTESLGVRIGSTQPMPVATTTSQLSGEVLPSRTKPFPSAADRGAGRADSGGVTSRRSGRGRVVWASLAAVAMAVIAMLTLRGSSPAPSAAGPSGPGEPLARQPSSSSSSESHLAKAVPPTPAAEPPAPEVAPPPVHDPEAAPTERKRERTLDAESAVKSKAQVKRGASPASASARSVDAAKAGAKKRTVTASAPAGDVAPAAPAGKDPLDGRR
jgi:serine/threonine-protein kinase